MTSRALLLRRWSPNATSTVKPWQGNGNHRVLTKDFIKLFQQQHRSHTPAIQMQAVCAFSTQSSEQCHTSTSRDGNDWMGLAMAGLFATAAATAAASSIQTTCEAAKPETTKISKQDEINNENNNNNNKEEEEEDKYTIGPDDPFYHVPSEDQDEPTECQMCRTFRQGPCRVDWKRFELCIKSKDDNSKDGSGDNKTAKKDTDMGQADPLACMKYAMSFYNCSSKHMNSYLIIGNEQTQQSVMEPLLASFDLESAQSRRLCWNTNTESEESAIFMDWTQWETFVTKLHELNGQVPTRFALNKTGFQTPAEALRASWKSGNQQQYLMMDGDGEPYLISIQAFLPLDPPTTTSSTISSSTSQTATPPQRRLKMTFALDQDGNLIGDAHNKESDDQHKREPAADGDSGKKPEGNSNNNDESSIPTIMPMTINLIPGVTQSFKLYALYSPIDPEADLVEDGLLVESKPYVLEEVTQQAIENFNKAASAQAVKSSGDAANEGDSVPTKMAESA